VNDKGGKLLRMYCCNW